MEIRKENSILTPVHAEVGKDFDICYQKLENFTNKLFFNNNSDFLRFFSPMLFPFA